MTLVCRAKGHPTPRITWRREDGQDIVRNPARVKSGEKMYEGETLTISRVYVRAWVPTCALPAMMSRPPSARGSASMSTVRMSSYNLLTLKI